MGPVTVSLCHRKGNFCNNSFGDLARVGREQAELGWNPGVPDVQPPWTTFLHTRCWVQGQRVHLVPLNSEVRGSQRCPRGPIGVLSGAFSGQGWWHLGPLCSDRASQQSEDRECEGVQEEDTATSSKDQAFRIILVSWEELEPRSGQGWFS